MVQVGTNVGENLVTTASIFPPATESPPRNNELVALCHDLVLWEVELRITLPSLPVGETEEIIPSLLPNNLVPNIDSELAPKIPTPLRPSFTSAFNSVSVLPRMRALLIRPFKSAVA